MRRVLPVLLLTGCSNLLGSEPIDPTVRTPIPLADEPDSEVLPDDTLLESTILDPVALATGQVLTPPVPVRTARWTLTADPDAVVTVRTTDGTTWSEPRELGWDEVNGEVRSATTDFGRPVSGLEITASGAVAFLQLEWFVGDPLGDEDAAEDAGRERAAPGWWSPDAETLAIGQTMYLPYTYATSCSGGARPGAVVLAKFLLDHFDADSYGIYNCRPIPGTTTMSVHGDGRAIDLMIAPDTSVSYPSNADNDRGDEVAAWLVTHAEEIGFSYLIWDRGSWGAHRSGTKYSYYTGTHPHNDHLHIELTPDAAQNLTTAQLEALLAPAHEVRTGWVGMAADGDGYRLVHSDGTVAAFNATDLGGANGVSAYPVVDIATGPGGYWIAADDGGVFSFGTSFYGSMGGEPLNAPVTAIAAAPDGAGYWLAAEDGGVFAFGSAGFYGSMGGLPLNAPVVDIDGTPSGAGYWMVAEDGGVFAFGDAGFYGSMADTTLNAPVSGIAATPTGLGYWLVAEDGGIFAFGDAGFLGSMADTSLAMPMSGIDAGPGGYWTNAWDGGVFSFGTTYHGGAN